MTVPAATPQIIESYRGGGFRVSGLRYEGSVLVFRARTLPWPVAACAQIEPTALAAAVGDPGDAVELLLIGCGRRLVPVAPPVRAALKAIGIAVEPMDTGAACRTFNVLAAEERRVAAALIAVA
ncbi:MAG: Mth938-like domain-containing protein [Alphaproteobacteria bacterium]|nr:Mth938-like domain-containing protein [Alphaproteobacteria bacterium]